MSCVEFYRHQLGEDEALAWRKVLDTLYLALGPQVAMFERELGDYLIRERPGSVRPQVIGTSSCSMGMLIALRALDVGPGDEVITTPMTFASTANAILHLGGKPKLVDVEAGTGLIDPERAAAAIGPRTRGIMPVHLYGQLADLKALRTLADAHGLFIVEDSAHGIEMERDGVRPGDLAEATVFSFHASKNLTSGDGGAIATRDPKLAERMRRLRNHGLGSAPTVETDGYEHWDLVELGYKANLTDLEAALLRVQLPKVEAKRDSRERISRRYESALREARLPGLGLIEPRGRSSHHLFTIHAPLGMRDRLLNRLEEAEIGTAVHYRAIHTLTYLRDLLKLSPGSLPIAEQIGARTLSLPMYPSLTLAEQDRVIAAVLQSWPR